MLSMFKKEEVNEEPIVIRILAATVTEQLTVLIAYRREDGRLQTLEIEDADIRPNVKNLQNAFLYKEVVGPKGCRKDGRWNILATRKEVDQEISRIN